MRKNTKYICFEYEGEIYAVDFRYNWLRGIYDVQIYMGKEQTGQFNKKIKRLNCTGNAIKRFMGWVRSFYYPLENLYYRKFGR